METLETFFQFRQDKFASRIWWTPADSPTTQFEWWCNLKELTKQSQVYPNNEFTDTADDASICASKYRDNVKQLQLKCSEYTVITVWNCYADSNNFSIGLRK